MRIGELARKTGASVRTLRHYENSGLLHATRSEGGYRDFPAGSVARVRKIRTLLDCGFNVAEIRGFLPCFDVKADHQDCPEGRERHLAKLVEVDQLLRVLHARRHLLAERLALFGMNPPPLETEPEDIHESAADHFPVPRQLHHRRG